MRLSVPALRSVMLWLLATMAVVLWLPLVTVLGRLERDPLKRTTGRFFRRLGVLFVRLHGSRVALRPDETPDPHRTYVVVSNHQSMADIPALCHLPWEMKWIAKAELFRTPLLGRMMRLAGDIPVDRRRFSSIAAAVRRARATLAAGCSVMVFPEGTRSIDGTVAEFRRGAFHLAVRGGVPILPVAVDGSLGCLPRGTWRFGPATDIRFRIFPPIETRDLTRRDINALRDRVRQTISDQVTEWRTPSP
jgi:1-acyl-sn-glycerol-3-phosphate acyltransferase